MVVARDWQVYAILNCFAAEFQNEKSPHRFMYVAKQLCASGELYRNTTFDFSFEGQPTATAGGATSGESSVRQYETYHGIKVQLK